MFVAIASAAAAASAQTAPTAAPGQPAATAQQVVAVTPVPSPLASIPGVTVTYYDVTGNTIDALNAAIAAQRPKDAATGAPIPSSAKWSIGVNVKKATTGTVCKLTDATPRFTGEVVMPRLVNAETVPVPVRNQWAAYVASMEQRHAETLRRPYQRLGEVRTAVMASSCEGASAAANRAIAEITKAPPAPVAAPAAVTPTP
jgi:predicted secreted Zn-dependent protease